MKIYTNVKLAFYIGNDTLQDKLINLWTRGKSSHVEIVVDNDWYSTGPDEQKVRKTDRTQYLSYDKNNWEFLDIKISKETFEKGLSFFEQTKGHKYDWLGIFLTQFLPFGIQDKEKWFCSEWCGRFLGLKNPSRYSPNRLRKIIERRLKENPDELY